MKFMPTERATGNSLSSGLVNKRAKTRAQHRGQDLEAFEQMLLTTRSKFVALAYSILRNKEDAEDAVQDAFLSAYLHLRTYEGRAELRTWFTRIVMNAALMLRRKRKPTRFVPLVDTEPNDDFGVCGQVPAVVPEPEKAYDDEQALKRISIEVEKLRPALQEAFRMTYYGELSHEEACRILNIPIGTFKARLFRARRLIASGLSRACRKTAKSTPSWNDYHHGAEALIQRVAA
jgi:RNA polymerase sigma-70 factor (ECF subfamily)